MKSIKIHNMMLIEIYNNKSTVIGGYEVTKKSKSIEAS